jgi:hypothetical protein
MATQQDKDWEEYQYGLQGTPTGSMHNQMGLQDTGSSQPVSDNGAKTKIRTSLERKSSTGAAAKADFSVFFAMVGFVCTVVYLYEPTDENGVAALIFAAVVGAIAGNFYKWIISLTVVIGILMVIGNTQ